MPGTPDETKGVRAGANARHQPHQASGAKVVANEVSRKHRYPTVAIEKAAADRGDPAHVLNTLERPRFSTRQRVEEVSEQRKVPSDVDERQRSSVGGSAYPDLASNERVVLVVQRGVPASSFLMYKLTGDNADHYWDREACDRLMPADRGGEDVPLVLLDPGAVHTVRLWIEQGAVLE